MYRSISNNIQKSLKYWENKILRKHWIHSHQIKNKIKGCLLLFNIFSKSANHHNQKGFRDIKSVKWVNKIDFGDYILTQLENPR